MAIKEIPEIKLPVGSDIQYDDTVVPFAKPEGSGPKVDDWLSKLPTGTRFICRANNPMVPWLLTEAVMGGIKHGAVLLFLEGKFTWVMPETFSSRHTLWTIIEKEE